MKRAALALVALGAFGCGDLTPPQRFYYAFDLSGSVFHWPEDRLPVRYFADTRGAMSRFVREAIAAWERQFLYGEFRGVLVADTSQADVIIVWRDSVPPDVAPDTAGAVDACGGLTLFFLDSTDTMTGPARVELSVNPGYTPAQVAACMRRVAKHEVGHTLGLLLHSINPADLMYSQPEVNLPSEIDRATVEVLYHTAPTIAPPP